MNKLIYLCASFYLVKNVFSYNILLVFPHPGKSHAALGESYVRHLLKAGHEVTYITPFPLASQSRLKQVDLSSTVAPYKKDLEVVSLDNLLSGNLIIDDINFLYEFSFLANNRSIHHKDVQQFLMESNDTYDLAIIQWFNSELNTGYPAVFNIPYIWASSYEHHPVMFSMIDEFPNPASFRNHVSHVFPPLTFVERIEELWTVVILVLTIWSTSARNEIAFREAYGPAAAKRGITLPTLEEMKYKSSLVFGNAHPVIGEANKLPQNYIPIGGFHIDENVEPLSKQLQQVMDESKEGVIYFSMGSNVKSASMPKQMKKDLVKMFSELNQTVIWTYEEELKDKPENLHIVKWAPQQSILAHPNCKIFISHGGLLSITEALHFRVPIIGIPLFVDHFVNMMRAVKRGYGYQIDLGYDLPAKLKLAIKDMLSNPKYQEKVEYFSYIYHHRPIKPVAAILYWVDHVIKTEGAAYLQSPALHVPWYQKMYLDLLGVIIITIVIIIYVYQKLISLNQKTEIKLKRS